MTVGYMKDVATATSFTFLRLLFRWRGSVWKAIYLELFLWLFLFVNIRTLYDFILVDSEYGKVFEQIVIKCRDITATSRTVITFALGFYVSFVTNRWWNVFMTIPWPDTTALQLTAYLRTRGKKYELEDRTERQTIMRYMILSYVLVFRDVSVRIKKRFPTYDHLTPTLMTLEEREKIEKTKESRHWVPIEWALMILKGAEKKGCIDSYHLSEVTRSILQYRQQLHDILSYDWISVPLVYVQAVNICTICYFLIQSFSSQIIYEDDTEKIVHSIIPIYTLIEFVVFNGWLKTAFVMLNPFGQDDDDFEMDVLIERNLMISLCYVNDFFDKPPKLINMTVKLPHTIQSAAILSKANPMHGSAVTVQIPKQQQRLLNHNQANMMANMMPHVSATNTPRAKLPFDVMEDQEDLNAKRVPRGPDTSKKELGSKGSYILKKEDLENAVMKLLEKRLGENSERLNTQKTQSLEEPTQETETLPIGGPTTSKIGGEKKGSKIGCSPSERTKQVKNLRERMSTFKFPSKSPSNAVINKLGSRMGSRMGSRNNSARRNSADKKGDSSRRKLKRVPSVEKCEPTQPD